MSVYAHRISHGTPQTQRAPGRNDQVRNSERGFVFKVSDMDRVRRFLILGSEAGSFYVNPQKLTTENAETLIKMIKEDGPKVVDLIVEVSDNALASKNTPAIFALSLCMSEQFADYKTRQKAAKALPIVCRIGTHLFQFAESVKQFRGWGRSLRDALANWYRAKDISTLQYQMAKYQARNTVEGKKNTVWSHCDILRKSHAFPKDSAMSNLFRWAARGELSEEAARQLPFIEAVEEVKQCQSPKRLISLIEEHRLPREVIPTKFLKNCDVLCAMLPHMPLTALVRNLGNLSANGVLVNGAWDEIKLVVNKLTNRDYIHRSRIHPVQALAALITYSNGRGFRGGNSWHPIADIKSALDTMFELSFHNVESTGKRTMLSLDVSGSMGWTESTIPNLGITARDASAAMAMINYRKEERSFVTAFSHGLSELSIGRRDSIHNVIDQISRLPFGGTDCSLPMLYALERNLEIDTFVIYTDNETYAGSSHPYQALNLYRKKSGINAKLVVVGMVSNGFTIADPRDPGMLDVVGFDSSAPSVIAQFSKGEL